MVDYVHAGKLHLAAWKTLDRSTGFEVLGDAIAHLVQLDGAFCGARVYFADVLVAR